jgi:hypothetical protein
MYSILRDNWYVIVLPASYGSCCGGNILARGPSRERPIIHEGLTDHYRRTLDKPIPNLGNPSPHKTAKTRKGREKVIGWLKMLENHSAQLGRDDPVGSYDFTWILKELGLGDERR